MPRRIDNDEETPRRRRRSAKAAAIEAEEERGLVMRIFLHSPKDVVAGLIAATAICAIITNALFLQAGRHPSPMFGSVVTLPPPQAAVANPLPRPRPVVEADPQEALFKAAEGGFDMAIVSLELTGHDGLRLCSQLRSLDPYRRAVAALAQVGDFDVYDPGGGLGVPYVEGDEAVAAPCQPQHRAERCPLAPVLIEDEVAQRVLHQAFASE